MLVIAWIVVSDSESVLIATNAFFPEECSVSLQSRLDLELHSIGNWIFVLGLAFSV